MLTPYSDGVFYANNKRINPFLVSCVEMLSPASAVDFGCGMGVNACYLQEKGWIVWVVEREDLAINAVRKYFPHDRIFQSDIREFDFSLLPDVSLVVCNYVLQHLSVVESELFLQKIVEKLPIGGRIMLSIFERENAIDSVTLKKYLMSNKCKLVQEKLWTRWDTDHGPVHFHRGYESFWEREK